MPPGVRRSASVLLALAALALFARESSALNLSPSKPSPQQIGATIDFIAMQSTPGPHQYRFWISPDGGATWQVAREWDGGSIFHFVPAATGSYQIGVWVRRVNSAADFDEAVSIPFQIVPPPPASVTFSTGLPSPQETGTSIPLVAQASGGKAPHQFKFWGSPDGGATWQVLRDWGAETFSWTPLVPSAQWLVGAWVRSAGNTADASEDAKAIPFVVSPPALTSVTASKPSPQQTGTTITLLAQTASGKPGRQFKFWGSPDGGATWQMLRDWGGPSFDWVPSVASANWYVGAWVRSGNNGIDASEDSKVIPFVVKSPPPATITSVTASPPGPRLLGTQITFRAAASSGRAPYQFKYWRSADGGATWVMLRDWGSDTLLWMPGMSASWLIGVWVRSAGSTADAFEDTELLTYVVNPLPPLRVTDIVPNQPEPALPGAAVSFTARSVGGLQPASYKWYVSADDGLTWTLAKNWSTAPFVWTAAAPGRNHRIGVWGRSAFEARDVASTTYSEGFYVRPVKPPPLYDFDGNGTSDLFLDDGGAIGILLLSGANLIAGGSPATLPNTSTEWAPVGDLDGNGTSDLLLHDRATGALETFLMVGTAAGANLSAGSVPLGWELLDSGDLNGDGDPDHIWWNSASGDVHGELLAGTQSIDREILASAPGAEQPDGCLTDFDGDGRDDLLLVAANGALVLRRLDGLAVVATHNLGTVPAGYELASCGDASGDGKGDLYLDSLSGGSGQFWLTNGSSVTSPPVPIDLRGASRHAVFGIDPDGDGDLDLLWDDPDQAGILFLNGTSFVRDQVLSP